jgi:hypothetical protein
MNHPTEEELIAYHGGDTEGQTTVATHVADCPECREELERIDNFLSAVSSIEVPEPAEDYGRRVWQEIAPRLPEHAGSRWRMWLAPRRLAAFGVVAAIVVAAFLTGLWMRPGGRGNNVVNAPVPNPVQVREKVLVVAVGQHLGRSEMILIELQNAAPNRGEKRIDISTEQRRAEDLVAENRLYRQTALKQGDAGLASTLDELERVLVDIAHSPQEVTEAQLQSIRERIEANGILFKIRVIGDGMRNPQKRHPSPGQRPTEKKERKTT